MGLLKDVSESTGELPCNIILDGLEQEGEPCRRQGYASTYKAQYSGLDVSVTVVEDITVTANVKKASTLSVASGCLLTCVIIHAEMEALGITVASTRS